MVDVFRVPMDVTYALAGGEPAGIAKEDIEAIEDGNKEIEEEMLESLSTALKVPQDQLI
jgi:hypothetical protein